MTKEMEYTDYTPDLYTLVDDNGNESTFEMLDAMEVDGEQYFALTPYFENDAEAALQDSGEVVILKTAIDEEGEEIVKTYPTPFHLYDEAGIRANAKAVCEAFSWNPGFREYFAVKATPNPFLLDILKEYDMGCDCSSMTELMPMSLVQSLTWMILPTLLVWKKP